MPNIYREVLLAWEYLDLLDDTDSFHKCWTNMLTTIHTQTPLNTTTGILIDAKLKLVKWRLLGCPLINYTNIFKSIIIYCKALQRLVLESLMGKMLLSVINSDFRTDVATLTWTLLDVISQSSLNSLFSHV